MIDVKRVHGEVFAVVTGGTHHLRTPVAKGHDQPLAVLPTGRTGTRLTGATGAGVTGAGVTGVAGAGGARVGGVTDEPVTVVGQLCTPKDVFARRVPMSVNVGDIIAFGMAGAYAWTISHHDFLMHPKPGFHYLT